MFQHSSGYTMNPAYQSLDLPTTTPTSFQPFAPTYQLGANPTQPEDPALAQFTGGMDFMANPPSVNRQISFGGWYQPFSPGLVTASMTDPTVPRSTPLNGAQETRMMGMGSGSSPSGSTHSIPTMNSSPLVNVMSPEEIRSLSFRTNTTGSSATSPHISRLDPVPMNGLSIGSGDGFSSSLPVPRSGETTDQVAVMRGPKKRACEQCNASKVKCDSQLPCRELSPSSLTRR